MKLEHILPRALGDSHSDCASIFTSLVMGAHFERSRARSLGWRGVRPSASEHPAWTCRVAGSGLVFGIRFDGEERCVAASHAVSPDSDQAASAPIACAAISAFTPFLLRIPPCWTRFLWRRFSVPFPPVMRMPSVNFPAANLRFRPFAWGSFGLTPLLRGMPWP